MTDDRHEAAVADTATDEMERMSDDEAAEVSDIRADIDETQAEMSGTLRELGDRLEPGHLVNEAKEKVRDATVGRVEDTAKGVSEMVIETIKRNPIPAAMAGAGLALLWANRSNGHIQPTPGAYGKQTPGAFGKSTSSGPGVGDRVGNVASSVGDSVSGAADKVGQTAGDVGTNIGQTAGQVGGQLESLMQASPLAMGAIAVGAGAVVGALIPETPQEREFLGDAGQQIGDTVRQTVDKAATAAEQALDRTEENVATSSTGY